MLVPLVRTLQSSMPQAKITWVISRPAYDLVEGMDGVEFIVIDKPSSLTDYWRFKQQMRGRHFDVLLATQASFRANVLYACIRATRKVGYDAIRAKDGHGWFIDESIEPGHDHTLDGFLRFADVLGIREKQIRWDLPIQEQDYAGWQHRGAVRRHTGSAFIGPHFRGAHIRGRHRRHAACHGSGHPA